MKLKRFGLAFLACILIVCSLTSAFAATGFEEGPSEWIKGDGKHPFGNTIVATATGNDLYVYGKARFKTSGPLQERVASVAIALEDVRSNTVLGFASKTDSIRANGAMVTDYFLLKGKERISYTKGQKCQYTVTRSGLTDLVYGMYIGYLTT